MPYLNSKDTRFLANVKGRKERPGVERESADWLMSAKKAKLGVRLGKEAALRGTAFCKVHLGFVVQQVQFEIFMQADNDSKWCEQDPYQQIKNFSGSKRISGVIRGDEKVAVLQMNCIDCRPMMH